MFKSLETSRLYLKNIDMEDAPFILEEFSNDDINRYLFDAEPMQTLEDAKELIDFYNEPEPRNQHRWILVRKSDGVKMGTCGFHCWYKNIDQIETGYEMMKTYWGNGYMNEAMKAILDFAKEELGVGEVVANIYPDNQKSIATVERLGFHKTSETKDFVFHGKNYIHSIYSKSLK